MQKQKVVFKALALVLIAAGVVIAVVGIGTATWWRPDPVLSANLADSDQVVTTAPGVLGMGADAVLISAQGEPTEQVVLVLGRQSDVAGWLASAPHRSVTGLVDRETLAATTSDSAAVALPNPAGLDMWLVESVNEANAELSWTATDDQVVLLAATVGADGQVTGSPQLTLSWNVPVPRNWLVPGIVVGLVLLAIGAFLQLRTRQSGTEDETAIDETAASVNEKNLAEPQWHSGPPAWQEAQPTEEPAWQVAQPAEEPVWHSAAQPSTTASLPLAEPASDEIAAEEPTAPVTFEPSEAVTPQIAPPYQPPAAAPTPEAPYQPVYAPEPAPVSQPEAEATPQPPAAQPAAPDIKPGEPLTRKRLRELKLQGQLPEEYADWGDK